MKLSLSSTIYPQQCLVETIAAFADFCSVSIAHEPSKSYSIEILPISPASNEEVLTNEFLNYLLAVSIENHLSNLLN
jgi:hypothetical protein